MILSPCPLHSDYFSYHADSQTFAAELSDLKGKFYVDRVYDDACDEGFTIVSARTGKKAVFALNGHEKDAEGDLLLMNYVCVTPGLKNLRAVLFND